MFQILVMYSNLTIAPSSDSQVSTETVTQIALTDIFTL